MSRPRGGRHRDPAESRRLLLFTILLAFGISAAITSLWALSSPQERDSALPEEGATVATGGAPATGQVPEFDVDDAAVQTQAAEDEPTPQDPESTSPEPDSGGGGGGGGGGGADDGGSPPSSDGGPAEEIRTLVNDERAAVGCGGLEAQSQLDAAAQGHAEDMASADYFDHTSRDGRSPTDRAREQGYRGGVGENIAYGYPDAASVMDGWMNSEGHRANILNCDYQYIGIGIADRNGTLYWVQNFG